MMPMSSTKFARGEPPGGIMNMRARRKAPSTGPFDPTKGLFLSGGAQRLVGKWLSQ
jgi:hypothetical protein